MSEEVRTAEQQHDHSPSEVGAVELPEGATETFTGNAAEAPMTTGGRLRAGREAAGMTVADIAEILRFSPHQIEALEKDDYQKLAGTTLVRGMVRGYAKLLKMPPEPLLTGLEAVSKPAGADVRAPTNIGVAERATTADRISRGAVILVGVFVLLFCLLAGYVYVMADEAVVQQAAANPAVAPVVVMAPSTPAPPAPPPSTVVEPVAVAAPTTDNAAAVTALPPSNLLVLDFDDLSWVEISDATHSIVFRGEHPKGTHQVVDGKAPFQLWIGRASAVRVTYGERVIDLKPHSRENIARLTLE